MTQGAASRRRSDSRRVNRAHLGVRFVRIVANMFLPMKMVFREPWGVAKRAMAQRGCD